MEQKEIIATHGVVTIRPIKASELKEAAKLLKISFKEHNIFSGTPKQIRDYLAKSAKSASKNLIKTGIIVAVLKEGKKQVIAGVMKISQKAFSKKGLHASISYSHIAVSEKYRKHGIGAKLIKYADGQINTLIEKGKIASARVQVNVSDNEKETIQFYEKSGFSVEATLNHYYRRNEQVFILSKLIEGKKQD